MSAIAKLPDRRDPLQLSRKALGASGQFGYGIPEKSLAAGIERAPDYIGADMGSIDPGPYYLGSGELAMAPATTRADLTRLLRAARKLDIPLLIGTAGSAGAARHLEKTLAMVREIARADGLHFRLASISADIPRQLVRETVRSGRVRPIDSMAPLSEADIDEASHLVGQMGTEAFCRALRAEADVVIAGRACDTAIFAAVPALLGCAMGPAMHMAKIIECASLCCLPGGREPILATRARKHEPRTARNDVGRRPGSTSRAIPTVSPSRKACCSSAPRIMKRSMTGAPGSPARSGSPLLGRRSSSKGSASARSCYAAPATSGSSPVLPFGLASVAPGGERAW